MSYNDFYLSPVIPDLLRIVILGEFNKVWKVNVYLHSDTKEFFFNHLFMAGDTDFLFKLVIWCF